MPEPISANFIRQIMPERFFLQQVSTWHDGLVALDPMAESGGLGQLSDNRIGHHPGVRDDIEKTMVIGRLSNDVGYSLTQRRILKRIRVPTEPHKERRARKTKSSHDKFAP